MSRCKRLSDTIKKIPGFGTVATTGTTVKGIRAGFDFTPQWLLLSLARHRGNPDDVHPIQNRFQETIYTPC
jgi:hypothetical protein